jgi:hypothetical protein
MGRIEATQLACERSVLAANPADARRANLGHSVTDWSVPLVRKPDSTGL